MSVSFRLDGEAEEGSVWEVLLVLLERATEAMDCGTCGRKKSLRRREMRRLTADLASDCWGT